MSRKIAPTDLTQRETAYPAADAPFDDTFLSRWVNAQRGALERRGIIRLSIQTASRQGDRRSGASIPDGASGEGAASKRIADAGGQVIAADKRRLIAVWGARRSDHGDCRRALEAAISIVRDAGSAIRILLDARFALVPTEPEDGVLRGVDDDAMSWDYVVSALPQGVVLTQTFRDLAGLGRGLFALSTASIDSDGGSAVLYALPASTGPALDRIFSDCTVATTEALDVPSPTYFEQLRRIDDLCDLKALVIVASVQGMTFSASVLARMVGIEEERLGAALRHGETIGVFERCTSRHRGRRHETPFYAFRDDALQQVAYSMVAEDDKRRLHAKAAEALGCLEVISSGDEEQVAAHHRHAANAEQSARWLGKAAWMAIEKGDTARAIKHLEAALATGPEETGSGHTERHLLQLLGVQVALARGNASAQFFDLYQRSLGEASSVSRDQSSGAEFRALWGLQSYHLVRGEIHAALTIGRVVMIRFVESYRDGSADGSRSTNHYKLLAHRMQGLATMLDGQLGEAERHYDTVLENYDLERDASLRFAFGSDQGALALAHRAWTRTLRGNAAGAQEDAILARRQAERLEHAHTSAHVLGVLSLAALQSGSLAEAALAAQETHAIAAENGFAYWSAWSSVVLAAAQKQNPGDQMRAMLRACSAYERENARQLLPLAYCGLGEIALAGGFMDQAQTAIEKGFRLSGIGGVAVQRPRLGLIEARRRRASGDAAGAAASLDAAYSQAKAFGANLFVRQITLEGCIHSKGRDQILWQRRYHAAL